MGNCYEDTPLRYRKLLCPALEFQALLCNGYSITNGGYINDIWAEDNHFHDWPQSEKEWPIHCNVYVYIFYMDLIKLIFIVTLK